MSEAALLGLGLIAGLDWRRLALILGVIHAPLAVAGLVAVHVWRMRPRPGTRAVLFCDGVAAELRAGSTLRSALAAASAAVSAIRVERLCSEGAPMAEIARAARAEFPEIGPEVAAVVERAATLGSPISALFEEIGGLALAEVQVAQEVRSATAPARMTAAVLLLAPVAALAWMAGRGGIGSLLEAPAQRLATLVGLALVLLGLFVAIVLLRRRR